MIEEALAALEAVAEKQAAAGESPVFVYEMHQKYGSLRIETNRMTHEIQGIVERAEKRSLHTCEMCGNLGRQMEIDDWMFTLCTTCAAAMKRHASPHDAEVNEAPRKSVAPDARFSEKKLRAAAKVRLLKFAQGVVAQSTAPTAPDFDVESWLSNWLELPQPALGGRMLSALLGTPEGERIVVRLLGAIVSGAYQ